MINFYIICLSFIFKVCIKQILGQGMMPIFISCPQIWAVRVPLGGSKGLVPILTFRGQRGLLKLVVYISEGLLLSAYIHKFL